MKPPMDTMLPAKDEERRASGRGNAPRRRAAVGDRRRGRVGADERGLDDDEEDRREEQACRSVPSGTLRAGILGLAGRDGRDLEALEREEGEVDALADAGYAMREWAAKACGIHGHQGDGEKA